MTTLIVHQIEEQFAHLSSEDQLSFLDRLAHQRLGVAGSNATSPEGLAGALVAGWENQRKVERAESRSGESDLLSEAW